MKKALVFLLFCFLSLPAWSQHHNSYETSWIKVDTLEKQGLYRSAWDVARQIFARASAAHDEQQQLKALVYQLKYRSKIQSGADPANLRALDSLCRAATGSQKAILQSMLAEAYSQYMSYNRYRLYGRLSSAAEDDEDISTWSLSHFYEKITALYQASVLPQAMLGNIFLRDLTVVVDTGNGLQFQPTLYDLLARRALAFYHMPVTGVRTPGAPFVINTPRAFDAASRFSGLSFPTTDTSSMVWRALRLYQQLIRFHLDDVDKAALDDADIDRLQFVYQHAVVPGKDSLYRGALRRLIASGPGRPAYASASYQLASSYYSQGSAYNPLSHPQGRYDLKKALAICNTIPLRPVSEASVSAARLKEQILKADLSLTAEQVNLPNQPFRVLVTYKNTRRIYLRVVRLPGGPKAVSARPALNVSELLSLPVTHTREDTLPDPGDYQRHSVEIAVQGLPSGRYALLASGSKDFKEGAYPLVSVTYYVSAISYVHNGHGDFLVLNRESGKPLEGARVRFWKTHYNYTTRRRDIQSAGSYVTDSQGHLRVDSVREYTALLPEISWNGDHLYTGQSQYVPLVHSERAARDSVGEQTFLFTDRSIYRPGQILHFKGIAVRANQDTHASHVVAGKKDTIYLVDANRQRVDSLLVTANDFGSYSGSFVLSTGRLAGTFHLETRDRRGSASFSVESYKRPTFYLTWDTATLAYRLGDTIPVAGSVQTYAQVPVGGAQLSYEITRLTQVRVPYFRSWRPYPSHEASIAQGEVTTDAKGDFTIRFPALPDEETDSAVLPVFVYSISVTATDINGESHAFTQRIPLGYRSMQLTLDVPAAADVSALDSIGLSSRDLAGNFIPATVQLQLIPLKAPERYIRERYWQQPDQHLLSREAYLRLFPHDDYADQANPASWQQGRPLGSTTVRTNQGGSVRFLVAGVAPGWYQVLASATDKNGLPDTAIAYIRLYNPTDKTFSFTDPLWTSEDAVKVLPGAQAQWSVGSGQKAYILRQEESAGAAGRIQTAVFSDEFAQVSRPVTASDRGGVVVHYLTVRFNRLFTRDVRLDVPWEDKKLHIKYETFRDKLLPGAREQWRVKIEGPAGQQVSAEMLASMYDASLDAFKPHRWPNLALYPTVGSGTGWTGGAFGDMSSATLRYPKAIELPSYSHKDPSLRWFGYHPASPRIVYAYQRGQAAVSSVMKKDAVLGQAPAPEQVNDSAGSTPLEAASVAGSQPVRTNFNETAFFLPQLITDDSGDVIFSFTMPEALTRWNMMLFAHTRDMQYGYSEKQVITRKELMIQASAPRFVRQGDALIMRAKVNNLTAGGLKGSARLELFDLVTGMPVDSLFGNSDGIKALQVQAQGASVVSWMLKVPETYTGALSYRITTTAGNLSDGEQNALPVLSNSTLITDALPLYYRGNGTHHIDRYVPPGLGEPGGPVPQALTVEYAANPVWYAIMALPFMDEKLEGNLNASALFNRYYAHVLSASATRDIPGFESIMQNWIRSDSDALKSPLEQNQALKTVLLEETPWVRAAQSESAQRARVASWFNDPASGLRTAEALEQLKALQLPHGGFTWFKGMADDPFITMQIITGLGHLSQLDAWPAADTATLWSIVRQGVSYLDERMHEAYEKRPKKAADEGLSATAVRYLYMRSLLPQVSRKDSTDIIYRYYLQLAGRKWLGQSPYYEAMIALSLSRAGDQPKALTILKSLKERAMTDPVKGMYWKESENYRPWTAAPGETQAICIEAFQEITGDTATVSALSAWLLSRKQTHLWPNGNSTADAVFALLTVGHNWAAATPDVSVRLGDQEVLSLGHSEGAGYGKVTLTGTAMKASGTDVSVTIRNATSGQPSWGAVYFQYLRQMDKVSESEAPFSINRQVSLETATPAGARLTPVTAGASLAVGDKVQVRMTVKVDQDLSYVHLKDIRASCMEPLQVISGYHWQNGTGFYEVISDAAVHFYFQHLSKGTYVFTYPAYITQAGSFTGGLSVIECLYAPAFTAHSAGVALQVKE